jgi:dTDP-4-amino-4,6-dideoxygalactose transaminase
MKSILIHLPFFDDQDKLSLNKALDSTFVSGDGPECRIFEKNLASYLDVKSTLFTNSATTALETIIRALNLPKGSEVIVPDFTFTSTALAPLYNDLKIVLADVDPTNGLVTTETIKKVITPKTKLVIPVDYAGNSPAIDDIMELCAPLDIFVLQDCAQSIGTSYKSKKTGTIADAAVYSFHGTKNMTTGEGGAIICKSDELFEICRLIRDKGTNKHSFLTDNKTKGYYEYQSIGNSYVQSNLNAALGISQLEKLDWMNNRRKEIANKYNLAFESLPIEKINVNNNIDIYNWHLYGILVDDKYKLMEYLVENGINANVHYTPMHKNYFYQDLGIGKDFNGSLSFFKRLLRLPIYPSLSDKDVDFIIAKIKEYYV